MGMGRRRRDVGGGDGFEIGSSSPARKNCSGSLEKQAGDASSSPAAAENQPGPRDPAAGAPPPAARCGCCRVEVAAAGRWRWSEVEGLRCAQVSERAGSDTAAPGGSDGERCGLGGEKKRAGAAG